ncbi:hypothetical protein T06_12367 [Trichinella sp. T6]|nr:hypothetical protein T06_12367 [Trichinella sp. T6]
MIHKRRFEKYVHRFCPNCYDKPVPPHISHLDMHMLTIISGS